MSLNSFTQKNDSQERPLKKLLQVANWKMIPVLKQLRVSNKGKHQQLEARGHRSEFWTRQRLLPGLFNPPFGSGIETLVSDLLDVIFHETQPFPAFPQGPPCKAGIENWVPPQLTVTKSMQHLIYHEVSYIHWVGVFFRFSHVFWVVLYKNWRKLCQISHEMFMFRNQSQRSMFLIFRGKHSIASNSDISPSCSFTHKGHCTSMPIHTVFWLAKSCLEGPYIEWSASNLFAWQCGLSALCHKQGYERTILVW